MKNKFYAIIAILLVFVLISTSVLAVEDDDEDEIQVLGVDAEELITIGSSILATILFAITAVAYKRDRRKRLLYITIAFFLFAVKGFLISSDIFFLDKVGWVDPTASLLDFAILLSFFFGILKK